MLRHIHRIEWPEGVLGMGVYRLLKNIKTVFFTSTQLFFRITWTGHMT